MTGYEILSHHNTAAVVKLYSYKSKIFISQGRRNQQLRKLIPAKLNIGKPTHKIV